MCYASVSSNLADAAWENDWLQQICQLNISFTLLVAIVIRFKEQEDTLTNRSSTENTMAWLLLILTSLSAVSAVVLSVIESLGSTMNVKHHEQRASKASRAFRKRLLRDIVFVNPYDSHAESLTPSMLLAEELGGVPYRGKADVSSFLKELQLHPSSQWSAIPAAGRHNINVRVKRGGRWWTAAVPKTDLSPTWIELHDSPTLLRRQTLSSISSDVLQRSDSQRNSASPSPARERPANELQPASPKSAVKAAAESVASHASRNMSCVREASRKSGSWTSSAGASACRAHIASIPVEVVSTTASNAMLSATTSALPAQQTSHASACSAEETSADEKSRAQVRTALRGVKLGDGRALSQGNEPAGERLVTAHIHRAARARIDSAITSVSTTASSDTSTVELTIAPRANEELQQRSSPNEGIDTLPPSRQTCEAGAQISHAPSPPVVHLPTSMESMGTSSTIMRKTRNVPEAVRTASLWLRQQEEGQGEV